MLRQRVHDAGTERPATTNHRYELSGHEVAV
jgi:hypothetical protein